MRDGLAQRRRRYCLTLLLWLAPVAAWAEAAVQDVVVWNRLADNAVAYQVLQMALEHSVERFGPYRLTLSRPMEQGRMMHELQRGALVHVANFAPNAERERRLIPIRIPVTQGLLGYRVCLIRAGEQAAFDAVAGREDWTRQGLSIGQGTHWPDTAILEANGLRVVRSVKYEPLFDMLAKGRFDCFSRSVSEVLPELEKHADKGLVLEKGLVVVYRLPTFFFVSKQHPVIAQRLKYGMQQLIADGSLAAFIRRQFAAPLKAIGIQHRRVVALENPLLTDETRAILAQPSLWLDPLQQSR